MNWIALVGKLSHIVPDLPQDYIFKISTVFCVEELNIFPIIVVIEDQSKYKYKYMLICRLKNGNAELLDGR